MLNCVKTMRLGINNFIRKIQIQQSLYSCQINPIIIKLTSDIPTINNILLQRIRSELDQHFSFAH